MTVRSKRQYLSANARHGYKPGTWLSRHKDGQHFQVGQKTPMSPKHWKTTAHRDKTGVTSLELEAVKAERDMEAKGVKGFMIGIRLHDGTREEIPLMAQNWHQAFFIAHKNMMKYDPADIDEIVIVDPSLSEIAHAIAGGAHRFAGAIKAGVEKIPFYARRGIAFAEKAAVKTAREAGRIARIPGEARDVYELEKARREGTEVPAQAGQTEEQILAEASRLQRIGVAGVEPRAAPPKPEPSAFAGYTAEEWKALRERRAAEAKARTAPMTRSEAERRRRSTSRPFQSRVFGSNQSASSEPPEEPSTGTTLKKVQRELRRAQRAIRRLRE